MGVALLLPSAVFSQVAPVTRDDRFGIVHVSYAASHRDQIRYTRAANAGAAWNRWALYWTDVERSPGAFDWSGPDATIAADIANGFQSNPILLATPSFHNASFGAAAQPPRVEDKSAAFAVMRGQSIRRAAGPPIAPPSSLYQPTFADGTDAWAAGKPVNQSNVWARFVAGAATRYRGQVSVWEIWNEPDFSRFWSGSVTDYARLLKVAWLTIRSVDPSAQVLLGGMMYWEWTNRHGVDHAWLRAFLDEQARDPQAAAHGNYFDAIPWHFYSRPRDVYDKVQSAQALLAARGIGAKPHWIGETNAPACGEPPLNVSCSDPNYRGSATIQEQAAHVVQMYGFAAAAGVQRALFFQLQDDGNAESFGLFRNDGSARPAYTAYQVAARELGGWTSASRSVVGNQERIVVSTPRGRTTVLWARSAANETALVQAASASARLVEIDGAETTIVPAGGFYSVPLAGATNNRNFGGDPNDYITGGRPRLLVESIVPQPVPTLAPGLRRFLGPALPNRAALP